MGVLDDAIREHLELKRRHGASEDEIERQAAEALGPVRREPAARAAPDVGAEAVEHEEPSPGRVYAREPATSEAEPQRDDALADEVPADERLERERLAEESRMPDELEPTAIVDADALDDAPVTGPSAAGRGIPERDDVLAAEAADARGIEEEEEDVADEGWRESRPDQAITEEQPAAEEPPPVDRTIPGEETIVAPAAAAPEPELEEEEDLTAPAEPYREEPSAAPEEEDMLEETPEFLQDTPEDERLWFEQKPPRDFDLDR